MKSKWLAVLLIPSLLLVTPTIARADDATDRAAAVQMIKAKYIPTLDAQHATLLELRAKMKVDPKLLKQVNSVISDFENNYASIANGLTNESQAIQPIIDLCEEEIGEFDGSIYQLKLMASKIKNITCIKGKSSKSVSGLTPTCPAGYKKK